MSWLRLTKDLAVDSYLSLRRSGDTVYRRLFEQTPSAMDVMPDRGHATATGAGQSEDSSDDNQSSPKRQTRGAAVQHEKGHIHNLLAAIISTLADTIISVEKVLTKSGENPKYTQYIMVSLH